MTGGFPFSKLILQLFRQLCKPTSEKIVNYASRHPIFRQYFLLFPGRFYHRLEVAVHLLRNSNVTINKLPKHTPIKDEKAIQIGSQLMIEIVLFGLLVVVLVLETIRIQMKTRKDDERYYSELEALENRHLKAKQHVEASKAEAKKLRELIANLQQGLADEVR